MLLFSLLIGACETTGGLGGSAESRAERFARDGEHEEAARIYIGLAADTSGIERDRLTLLAVEQWLDGGDPARLAAMAEGLSTVVEPSKRLSEAQNGV